MGSPQGSFPREQSRRIIPRDHSPRNNAEESFPKEQAPGQGHLRVEHVTEALPELGTRVEEETSPLPHSPVGAIPLNASGD